MAESKLWKELERKREREELIAAYEAAKPFLDYWRRKRDEHQDLRGGIGHSISFPFMCEDGAWEITVPWKWDELSRARHALWDEMLAAEVSDETKSDWRWFRSKIGVPADE